MNRNRSILAICAMILVAGSLVMAQSNPFVGTWKLNIPASTFVPGPAPQSQERTWGADGVVKISGVNAAGKPTGYGYTINGDGKEYPVSGSIPNGSDTMTSKKAGPNKMTASFTKAGKVVESTTFTVSKDGKTLEIVAKGTLPDGKELNNDTKWDKQ